MIYIIKNGEFEMTKKIVIKKDKNNDRSASINEMIKSQQKKVNERENVNPVIKTFRVCLLGQGQMFGEEDVVQEQPYQCTVRCISASADVFCIKNEEFIRKLKPNKESWRVIIQMAE
jgi:CRP-like cAMP-binding protein